MSEDSGLIVLTPAASRALKAFADRIGQNPEELAAEAIERFIAEEEPIAEKVLQSLDDFAQGRWTSHEDALKSFDEAIERAARKRARDASATAPSLSSILRASSNGSRGTIPRRQKRYGSA